MHTEFKRKRIIMLVCGFLAVAAILITSLVLLKRARAEDFNQSDGFTEAGYTAAISYNDTFLAVGTEGRLDRITMDKQVTNLQLPTTGNLTSIWTDGVDVLIGGQDGLLLLSHDGEQFVELNSKVNSDIFGVTSFQGTYFASTEKGKILTSQDGKVWDTQTLNTKHDVISIQNNDHLIMAITAESDVLTSTDGITWEHDNFNVTYEGFYPDYTFTEVKNMGESFFVIGQVTDTPEVPLIMFSETGTVWMQKSLTAINGETPQNSYPLQLKAFGWNQDQLLVACGGGRVIAIPDCHTCNQILKVSEEELNAMALGDDKVCVVGENFYFDILGSAYLRQEKIKAEQAYFDLQNGAVIVDVREIAELEKDGYITGSINIPLKEVQTKLPELVPNKETEVIFYCAVGGRSQQALEQAQGLGYVKVYNLGGLSDWPYEITK